MYSDIYKTAPVLFVGVIMHNRDVHQYHTRNSGNVHIKHYRTVKVKIVLLNQGLLYWSSLPENITAVILSHHLIGCIKTIFFTILDFHEFKLLGHGLIVSLISCVCCNMHLRDWTKVC